MWEKQLTGLGLLINYDINNSGNMLLFSPKPLPIHLFSKTLNSDHPNTIILPLVLCG
jgi:hypothetical protein